MAMLKRNEKIHKKIYLDEFKKENGKIDWDLTIGKFIEFEYVDIKDKLYVIKRDDDSKYIHINYKNINYKVTTTTLHNASFKNILKPYLDNYKYKIGQRIIDSNRDFTITDRKTIRYTDEKGTNRTKRFYKYRCNICGFDCGEHYRIGEYKSEHWIVQEQIKIGCKCGCCDNKIIVTGINDIATTDKWMIPIINDIYFCKTNSKSCNRKVNYTCPNCGLTKKNKVTVNDLSNNRVGCDYCGKGTSYPNKLMGFLLNELNIEYNNEKTFDWCNFYNPYKKRNQTGRYDFYIPSINLIIEMDGEFHYVDNKLNNQCIDESRYIDNEKDKLAKENNLKVIRINCNYNKKYERLKEIKENIIKSELSNLFDLTNINWNNIDKLSNNNYDFKKIIYLWDNGYSVKQISKEINLNLTSTYRLLNICIKNNLVKRNNNFKKGSDINGNGKF